MGPQVMRNGVFPAISVNQDDKVISFQGAQKEEIYPWSDSYQIAATP